MPILTRKSEEALLEQIQTMPQIGICFHDPETNTFIQMYSSDPQLREALVEYQMQRLREVDLFEQRTQNGLSQYPPLQQ